MALLAITLSAGAQDFSYSSKKTYEVDKRGRLEFTSNDSDIKILAHDKNTVDVYYVIKQDGHLLTDSITPVEKLVTPDWNLLVSHSKKKLTIQLDKTTTSSNSLSVSLIMYVPKQIQTKIMLEKGNISLNGLKAIQYCLTNEGDIVVTDTTGKVIAVTYKGDVILDKVTGIVDSHNMSHRNEELATKD